MSEAVIDDTAVGQALAALHAAVDGLLALDVEAVPPVTLTEVLSGVEIERRRLDAVDVAVTAALAAQATPAQFGATSLPDLVGGLTRVSRAEARARAQRSIDLAPRRALTGEALDPIHPRTADALNAGEISGAHADVITHYLGRLPATSRSRRSQLPKRSWSRPPATRTQPPYAAPGRCCWPASIPTAPNPATSSSSGGAASASAGAATRTPCTAA